MAKKRNQFEVGIINIADVQAEGRDYVFYEANYGQRGFKSVKTFVSENRAFRMFSHKTEVRVKTIVDENGNEMNEEVTVRLAEEFIVVNFSYGGLSKEDKESAKLAIRRILKKGLTIVKLDGTRVTYRRVLTSASQTRVGKRLMTSLPVKEVRDGVSYGAEFPEEVKIANMEARYGLAESSTIEITNEDFSFDIMPDYAIERKHDIKVYDWKTRKLSTYKQHVDTYEPLDGQGTMLPSAAVRTAHRLELISRAEREMLLDWLEVYNQDVRLAEVEGNEEFLKVWSKVPSAFQIRFGFTKGLLLVYPHNLETKDCNGRKTRNTGKCMEFFGEKTHKYDFTKDIMFTDSMWKENFNPYYVSEECPSEKRVKLEIVLWQKNRLNDTVFMGYQYWQALRNDKISPKTFAGRALKELKETIFSNADDAKAFLGMYDTGRDAGEYDKKMSAAGGKIQKVIELLTENPDMIGERFVQETIRKTREKYVGDMAKGRIPVKGANPYIVTCPELQFGKKAVLKAGEYYYNGVESRFAAFRSPLIHKSEAVVLNTVDAPAYHVFNQDILIMNPFDDTLPRMGGADTDGDKVAMVENDEICDAVETGLPMLYDAGFKAGESPNSEAQIFKYDLATIINEDVLSIGEITNMSTAWKDIANNPKIMKERKINGESLTPARIDEIVCILRFMQGWSIDFAKTGFFPEVPEYVEIMEQPHWKQFNVMKKVNKEKNVFVSKSQLGQLFNAVKEYMETKFKQETKETTVDFTLEFLADVDDAEVNRIRPIISDLEGAYRKELMNMRDMELTDEEEQAHISHIMDKYTRAVQSIDGDIRDIAGAAYQHTYFSSTSKGKSISFPWVTCYDGLLLNVSKSTDTKTKLRKVQFDGHIDDVPAELKFYRNVSEGEDYRVESKLPNGTYKTFKRNGQVFIIMGTKSVAEKRQVERPIEQFATFEIKGWKFEDLSSHDVLALLEKNEGKIRLVQKKVNREVRVNVYAGKQRIGAVARDQKANVAQYVAETGACELTVTNLDKLEPTYMAKRSGKESEVQAFFLEMTFNRVLVKKQKAKKEEVTEVADRQEEVVTTSTNEQPYYVEEPAYTGYMEEEKAVVEMDDDMETEEYQEEAEVFTLNFNNDILDSMDLSADYWTADFDTEAMDVAGVSVEQTGKLAVGHECAVVTVVLGDGRKASVGVKAVAKGVFDVCRENMNPAFRALVLQFAHYELYVEAKGLRKQA